MKKRAFTLVELLVVISIIALLMGILMPALGRARALAKRVICGTRLKSIHTAAILYSNDDSRQRLPRGGVHTEKRTYADGIGMTIDTYFKMSNYITSVQGLPTDLDKISSMSPKDLAAIAKKCAEDGAGEIFLCPSFQKGFKDLLPDKVFRKKRSFRDGVIFTGGPPEFYTRIGYCYLAGFNTEEWNFNSLPGASDGRSRAWKSPKTTLDKGTSVVAADRVRFSPDFNINAVALPHTGNSYKLSEPHRNLDSLKYENFGGGTNVLTLDGAVQFRKFSETKARQMYNDNGDLKPNFTFF